MVVEVVDHIATTPRGKQKFIDQRLGDIAYTEYAKLEEV